MEPKEDLKLIRHYEELLAAVREVANRLQARIDDLRARFPDELSDARPPEAAADDLNPPG